MRWLRSLCWLIYNLNDVVSIARSTRKDVGNLHSEIEQIYAVIHGFSSDLHQRINVHQQIGHPRPGTSN